MFHPLEGNLEELKDAEVEAKLSELNKKYSQAARLGNQELLTQIATFVTIYRDEVRRRALTAKLNNANDKDLDQLINVD